MTHRANDKGAAPAASSRIFTREDGRILLSAEPLAGSGAPRPRPAETLLNVSKAVGSRLGLDEVLRQTTSELARALGADIGSVWRLGPTTSDAEPVARYPAPTNVPDAAISVLNASHRLLTSGICRTGAPVYSSDSAHDGRFEYPLLGTLRHRSVLMHPLRVKGHLAGMFVFIWTRARHRFEPVELRLVDAVTQQAGIAIENAELVAEIARFNEQLERRVADRTARLKRTSAELRASRRELRALSTHMERIREGERTQIAREIHDQLGQSLTALKIDLARLLDDPVAVADPGRLLVMVDSMVDTVRRIASELRPQILDDLGLVATIEWQAEQFEKRTGVRCRVRCTGDTSMEVDADRSTALFRILQEILTNVARHAAASRIDITLSLGKASVRLDVRDDGKGIGELPRPRERLGLLGMEERAAAFNGRVIVSDAPRRGTLVRVRVPLASGAGRRVES